MKLKTLLIIIPSLIAALMLSLASAYASESLSVRGYPSSTGTAPKRLAQSTVTEIRDSVLTLTVNNAVHTVMIDDKTKITRNGKSAARADIKTGTKVRISFIEQSGHKVATAVEIISDEGREAAKPKPDLPQPRPAYKVAPALPR